MRLRVAGPVDRIRSVHGLCLIYVRFGEMPEPMRAAITEEPWPVALDIDATVDHVLGSSLAGIRALGET